MSQQGTPLGLTTPLNQARISAGTFSYCPRSKACAALANATMTAITMIWRPRRVRFAFTERAASHRLLRRSLQQFLQLLLVEFCAAGGEMPAGLGARRDQIQFAVLHPFHRGVGYPGFRRIAFVIGGIDREQRGIDLFK